MKQIHEINKQTEREYEGLTKEPTQIKDVSKDPGLSFVKNPEIKTRVELNERLKSDNV